MKIKFLTACVTVAGSFRKGEEAEVSKRDRDFLVSEGFAEDVKPARAKKRASNDS